MSFNYYKKTTFSYSLSQSPKNIKYDIIKTLKGKQAIQFVLYEAFCLNFFWKT